MRRLITSRVLRLALAVTAAGMAAGTVVWAWRALSRRGAPPARLASAPAPSIRRSSAPGSPVGLASAPGPAPREPVQEAVPPEPVLGRPSAADLRRYDPDRARPIGRWGYVAAACVVVFTGHFAPYLGPGEGGFLVGGGGPLVPYVEPGRGAGFAAGPSADPSAGSSPDHVAFPGDLPPSPDPACRPGRRPIVVREAGPRVTRPVVHQWRRIERWLRVHAPVTYGELRPPASARVVALAEAQMGVDLPASLRASLLRHNGSRTPGFAFPGAGTAGVRALGVREIRDAWRALCAEGRPGTVNRRLILFAGVEGGPGLEADPGHGGVGVLAGGGLMPATEIGWSSYYALLRDTARSLETGRPLRGLRPEVSAGRVLWTPAR
ncbi:SMI1/KNR4 family protein [Sphaerisporangium sp. NPDC049002]|uniref:SMI1/KNR4 family protein n=1 Tax=unclassified Sphaerisporangium TaxID=2630420 RepID=UPI0034021214